MDKEAKNQNKTIKHHEKAVLAFSWCFL